MLENMPSQREQEIAEKYVLERPLVRPDTDLKKAVKCVILYIIFTLAFGFFAFCVLERFGIFLYLSSNIQQFREEHKILFNILFVLLCYIISGVCCAKMAAIGCIRLYQHYAPEDVRRRCLFMPTCSEYTILAIQKYGLIIGLIKGYIRLFKKCRGNIYRIDYP